MKRPMAYRPLNTPNRCDICGLSRSGGNHKKCSKVRQAAHAAELNQQRSSTL